MTVAQKTLLLCMTAGLLAACQTAPQQRPMTGEPLYSRQSQATVMPNNTVRAQNVEPLPPATGKRATVSPPQTVPAVGPHDSKLEGTDWRFYEGDFRKHYESNYRDNGISYDQYRPAYHYGYRLAQDPAYSSSGWHTIEPYARETWEESQKGPWEKFKDAVHYAWERGRQSGG
jgi:hypothetical protein